jgi:hypothetical protein
MDDGDFNQDGNVDLVVVKRHTRVVSVLLGQGDGNFIHGLDLAPGTGVTVGDFDNDRIPDIAASMLQGPSNVGPGFVTVFLGNGDATFDPGIQVMDSVVSMHGLVSADFNRDGNLDLAGTDYYAGRVAVALGTGDGRFGQARTFGAGATGLSSLIAADLNADEVLDLAVSSRDDQRFSILYGDGTGVFGQAATYDAGVALEYLTAGDFNRDGQADLAASMYTTAGLSILLSDGMGSFLPPRQLEIGYQVANLAALDINRDGDLDLVFGVGRPDRTVAILLGQGDGTFGQPIAYEPEREDSEHAGIVVADFNNDKFPDVAVPARYDSVFVFLS